jgi:hypothetical protein
MHLAMRLRQLLVLLLIVGVGAVPLAANAVVFGPGKPAPMASMEPMAYGMPCCPDDVPAMPDCQKSCPLLATCMTKCAPAAPVALTIEAHRIVTLAAHHPGDDAAQVGSVSAPPARPPRT